MIALEPNMFDRRNTSRKKFTEPADVTLYHKGDLYWGTVVDLSVTGACFSLKVTTTTVIPLVIQGRLVKCYLTTMAGTAKCCGKVQWVEWKKDSIRWGISFTGLPHYEDDPLSILIHHHLENNVGKRYGINYPEMSAR